MSTQKVSSIKISQFDKETYNLWNMKMQLFLKAANSKYDDILHNGVVISMNIIPASETEGIVIPARAYPKVPSEYNDQDREQVSLDINLQLILVESLDSIMYTRVMNCTSAKYIWETIEIINEGTEEVRENRLEILTTEYEHFRCDPVEGISSVLDRYNKLINDLTLQGKYYTKREINRKFLPTMPDHLEHRITAIRENRDMNEVFLEKLYGILNELFAELNEVLTRELVEDGYSGVEVRVTPMRTEIIVRVTRTQNVLGEKGRRIRELTSVVQKRFKFPENSVELYAEKVNNRGLCAI